MLLCTCMNEAFCGLTFSVLLGLDLPVQVLGPLGTPYFTFEGASPRLSVVQFFPLTSVQNLYPSQRFFIEIKFI